MLSQVEWDMVGVYRSRAWWKPLHCGSSWVLAGIPESNSIKAGPGSPLPGMPGPWASLAHRGCSASLWGKNGWMGRESRLRKGALAEKEAADARQGWAHLEPRAPPVVVLLMAHHSSSHHNPQDSQDFRATCLVDEEEMKRLLQERGHMLENHVERLWAYLTIQELLAKR